MTTYYIDPANGNDANDGLGWGTAWKTITKSTTATTVATTDEFRIAKTLDTVDIGTCTWTVGSATVSVPSCSNIIVDQCESGWTAGLVTPTYQTAYARQGTNALQAVLVSANGKICHKTLTAADYSAHTRLTFWVCFSAAADYRSSNPFSIRLCSDTAGTVVVNTLTLPQLYYPANYWVPIVIDNGAGLGASIQSVALYTSSATSATVRIDNISVAKTASDPTSLALTDFVSPTLASPFWHSVRSIETSTSITVIAPVNQLASLLSMTYQNMAGSSTATSYKRTPLSTASMLPATATGTVAALMMNSDSPHTKTFIGGVNTTNDIVDGETWFDGVTGYGIGIAGPATFANMTMCRYYVNNNYTVLQNATGINHSLAANQQAIACYLAGAVYSNASIVSPTNVSACTFGTVSIGSYTTASLTVIGFPDTSSSSGAGIMSEYRPVIECQYVLVPSTGTGRGVFGISGVTDVEFTCTEALYAHSQSMWPLTFSSIAMVGGSYTFNHIWSAGSGMYIGAGTWMGTNIQGYNAPLLIRINGDCYNTTQLMPAGGAYAGGEITITFGMSGRFMNNISLASSATYTGNTHYTFVDLKMAATRTFAATGLGKSGLALINPFGSGTTHHLGANSRWSDTTPNYGWKYVTTTTHSGTGAWQHTNGFSTYSSYNMLPLGDVAVKAGSEVTISLWGKCPPTANQYLVIKPGSDASFQHDSVLMDQSDTWAQTSYSFTPDKNMVVKVYAVVMNCTTDGVVSYVDDLQVTQA